VLVSLSFPVSGIKKRDLGNEIKRRNVSLGNDYAFPRNRFRTCLSRKVETKKRPKRGFRFQAICSFDHGSYRPVASLVVFDELLFLQAAGCLTGGALRYAELVGDVSSARDSILDELKHLFIEGNFVTTDSDLSVSIGLEGPLPGPFASIRIALFGKNCFKPRAILVGISVFNLVDSDDPKRRVFAPSSAPHPAGGAGMMNDEHRDSAPTEVQEPIKNLHLAFGPSFSPSLG
jgi:hypothetical protein